MTTPFESLPVQPGEIVAGRYRVECVIGAGGMGVVVAARHTELDELVALKFLRVGGQRDGAPDRFYREARVMAKLRGPHVVRIFDLGLHEGITPFLALEYLEGRDLRRALSADGRFSRERAVDTVLEACEAVAEAHALGIVHRDLKPANIFLARARNGSDTVKLLDFGIAKSFDPEHDDASLTHSASRLGSTKYMSPEQLRSARDVTGRTDIWALGVVLYELLVGKSPFERASDADVAAAILNEPHPPLGDELPDAAALSAVVDRCLAKDAGDRFATVAALADALKPFASSRGARAVEVTQQWAKAEEADASATGAATAAPVPRLSPVSPRRPRARALAATGLVLIIGPAAWAVAGRSTHLPTPMQDTQDPGLALAAPLATGPPAERPPSDPSAKPLAPTESTSETTAGPRAAPLETAAPSGMASASSPPKAPPARPRARPAATAAATVDTDCPDPKCSRR